MAGDVDLTALAVPGTVVAVRVTPGARQARIAVEGEVIRVWVTVPPEGGKATAAVAEALARAMGVAKSRLVLVRGAASRDKLFRVAD